MVKSKPYIKIILILLIANLNFFVYADEIFDCFNGIWTNRRKCDPCLSIEKVKDDEYFVSYNCKYEQHVLDFSGIAKKISENKLLYEAEKKGDSEELFYIYYDYRYDSMYVLWNHEVPDDVFYDVKLERVSKLFGPDALTEEEMKQAQQERLEEIVMNYLLNEIQKKEQSSQ